MNIVITDNQHNYYINTDAVTNKTTLNSTQVFSELPPITRMDPMVSAITSLPTVYPSSSKRKSNMYTEDTSLTTAISMMSRL